MAGQTINASCGIGLGYNPYMMGNYSSSFLTDDLFAGTYSNYDPTMSMDCSLFDGMINPYMMPFTGGTTTNWMQQMDQWQDYNIDRQVRYSQKTRDADLKMNSYMEGIQDAGAILSKKIHQDEQEQIIPALKNYLAAVKAAYPDGTNEEILNRAKSLYKQQFGVELTDDIRANGKDSLTQGFLQAVSFGFADGKTAEENIAEIDGQPVGKKDKNKKIIGRAAGGAAIGGVATWLLSLAKCFKFLGKSKPLWGAAIGAVIAGCTALKAGES